MKIKYLFCFILVLAYGVNLFAQKNEEVWKNIEITSRLSAQQDIAKPHDIIDNTFIVVGARSPKGIVKRVETKKDTIYHFEATGNANRIEFTTCYGTEENLRGYSEEALNDLRVIKDIYINNDQGQYGQTITYDWYAKFPEEMTANGGGIFAQWHGRPDRTLVRTPEGELMKLEIKEFVKLLETMHFDKNIGKDNKSNKPNGWLVERSAGGPIAAFQFRPEYMYLIVRSEANRQSDPTFKVKPKPGKHLNKVIGRDGKDRFYCFSNANKTSTYK